MQVSMHPLCSFPLESLGFTLHFACVLRKFPPLRCLPLLWHRVSSLYIRSCVASFWCWAVPFSASRASPHFLLLASCSHCLVPASAAQAGLISLLTSSCSFPSAGIIRRSHHTWPYHFFKTGSSFFFPVKAYNCSMVNLWAHTPHFGIVLIWRCML